MDSMLLFQGTRFPFLCIECSQEPTLVCFLPMPQSHRRAALHPGTNSEGSQSRSPGKREIGTGEGLSGSADKGLEG